MADEKDPRLAAHELVELAASHQQAGTEVEAALLRAQAIADQRRALEAEEKEVLRQANERNEQRKELLVAMGRLATEHGLQPLLDTLLQLPLAAKAEEAPESTPAIATPPTTPAAKTAPAAAAPVEPEVIPPVAPPASRERRTAASRYEQLSQGLAAIKPRNVAKHNRKAERDFSEAEQLIVNVTKEGRVTINGQQVVMTPPRRVITGLLLVEPDKASTARQLRLSVPSTATEVRRCIEHTNIGKIVKDFNASLPKELIVSNGNAVGTKYWIAPYAVFKFEEDEAVAPSEHPVEEAAPIIQRSAVPEPPATEELSKPAPVAEPQPEPVVLDLVAEPETLHEPVTATEPAAEADTDQNTAGQDAQPELSEPIEMPVADEPEPDNNSPEPLVTLNATSQDLYEFNKRSNDIVGNELLIRCTLDPYEAELRFRDVIISFTSQEGVDLLAQMVKSPDRFRAESDAGQQLFSANVALLQQLMDHHILIITNGSFNDLAHATFRVSKRVRLELAKAPKNTAESLMPSAPAPERPADINPVTEIPLVEPELAFDDPVRLRRELVRITNQDAFIDSVRRQAEEAGIVPEEAVVQIGDMVRWRGAAPRPLGPAKELFNHLLKNFGRPLDFTDLRRSGYGVGSMEAAKHKLDKMKRETTIKSLREAFDWLQRSFPDMIEGDRDSLTGIRLRPYVLFVDERES